MSSGSGLAWISHGAALTSIALEQVDSPAVGWLVGFDELRGCRLTHLTLHLL